MWDIVGTAPARHVGGYTAIERLAGHGFEFFEHFGQQFQISRASGAVSQHILNTNVTLLAIYVSTRYFGSVNFSGFGRAALTSLHGSLDFWTTGALLFKQSWTDASCRLPASEGCTKERLSERLSFALGMGRSHEHRLHPRMRANLSLTNKVSFNPFIIKSYVI
jgi:hypothetical protein